LPERILAELDVFIETRLDGSISLSQLSEVARMSVFHFARSFKQSTGVAPHAYVLRRRIERACVLLGDARLTIAEVAQQCGFSQQSHFAQTFRRFLGKTPRAYRAERN
jgi:AraC family transcriptional regulator